MTPLSKNERINIRIQPELKRRALDKSRRTGIPLTHVLTKALQDWLKKPDPT